MGFSSGLQAGLRAREARDERVRREKIESGMADIENAQATDINTSTAASAEQVARGKAETDAMAAQDAKEFGIDKPMEYRVPTQVVAKTGTRFLGQEFQGDMTGGQKERAKMIAQAGVLSGAGDAQAGARLRREAQQSEREEVRFDRETKRYAKEDEAEENDKKYKADRQTAMADLRIAKMTSGYNEATKKYIEDQKAYDADKAAGKVVGAAPTPPVRGEYSAGDALADRAALLEVGARHGKVDDKAVTEFADMFRKVQEEGYTKALTIAQSGGTPEQIAAAFNETGKGRIDPATLVIRKAPGKSGGPDSPVIEFTGPDGKKKTVHVLPELEALGQADKVFTRFYQGKTDARADRGEIRADKSLAIQAASAGRADRNGAKDDSERKARADAAEAIYLENNPNATKAQLNAVRQGILDPVPKASGIDSDFKPDSYGTGGTATQKDKNGNLTITKIDGKGVPGKSVTISSSGKAAAPANPAAPGAPTRGAERTIAAGPNKGKTAVFDGTGWVLKP